MNVKVHKNCENPGKIPKISCVRCHFVNFDRYFLKLPAEIFFGVIADNYYIYSPSKMQKKECNML